LGHFAVLCLLGWSIFLEDIGILIVSNGAGKTDLEWIVFLRELGVANLLWFDVQIYLI